MDVTTLAIGTGDWLRSESAPRSAAEDAIRAHLGGVWRYLRMQGARPDEADDLAQECFVIAAKKRALELEPAATATFLRRTARFLLLRARRGGREAELLADAVDELWDRDCGSDKGDALLAALRRCLGALAPRAARAIRLAYGLGGDEPASRQAVAAELGLAENGVKTLMQRTRQRLRECLDQRREHDDQ
ncbi:MAG: RNA polymerase sigma factor [Planctomycetes bacterium]|nr:RNA polymerase sigma factor [Planctomycetota bacterium]